MKYYCSDLCPGQGMVVAKFDDLRNLEACCAAGGQPLMNFAWGGFRACAVPRGPEPSKLCQGKD
ncbi:MAG: hypothetical protein ABUL60_28600 [Myxococcales bacterium]